eukprot:scaffold18381_cov79-Phaeocystis_antarctica.AAC.5
MAMTTVPCALRAVAASLSGSTIPLQWPHLPHARPHLSEPGRWAGGQADGHGRAGGSHLRRCVGCGGGVGRRWRAPRRVECNQNAVRLGQGLGQLLRAAHHHVRVVVLRRHVSGVERPHLCREADLIEEERRRVAAVLGAGDDDGAALLVDLLDQRQHLLAVRVELLRQHLGQRLSTGALTVVDDDNMVAAACRSRLLLRRLGLRRRRCSLRRDGLRRRSHGEENSQATHENASTWAG